eukprot:4799630-Alexandrium_andersonii.AAC.1
MGVALHPSLNMPERPGVLSAMLYFHTFKKRVSDVPKLGMALNMPERPGVLRDGCRATPVSQHDRMRS